MDDDIHHCVRVRTDEEGHPVKPGAPFIGIDYLIFSSEMEARMFAAAYGGTYGLRVMGTRNQQITANNQLFSPVQDYGFYV